MYVLAHVHIQVGESPHKKLSQLRGLFVTEEEKIYVVDWARRKVRAFHPGDAAWADVLVCPPNMTPMDVVAQGRSLYVCIEVSNAQGTWDVEASGAYEVVLPPELQLEPHATAMRRRWWGP